MLLLEPHVFTNVINFNELLKLIVNKMKAIFNILQKVRKPPTTV